MLGSFGFSRKSIESKKLNAACQNANFIATPATLIQNLRQARLFEYEGETHEAHFTIWLKVEVKPTKRKIHNC